MIRYKMKKVYIKPTTKEIVLMQKHYLCDGSVTTTKEIDGPGGGTTVGEGGGGMSREFDFNDRQWFDEE